MHRMRGITLLELMIVVVIVSILAAVAYPNYRNFAARAKRNEAKAALLKIATNQERFYLQNNTYTLDMTQLGFPVADNYVTDSESYNVRVTAANASNFTATATYRHDDGEKLKCNLFQLDGRGNRISDPYTDCWTRTQ
jgi:type IV pilus assembly protein PilE